MKAKATTTTKVEKAEKIEETKDEPKIVEIKNESVSTNSIPRPTGATTNSSEPVKVIDKKISTYNGAETEKYNWSQSIKNVDV